MVLLYILNGFIIHPPCHNYVGANFKLNIKYKMSTTRRKQVVSSLDNNNNKTNTQNDIPKRKYQSSTTQDMGKDSTSHRGETSDQSSKKLKQPHAESTVSTNPKSEKQPALPDKLPLGVRSPMAEPSVVLSEPSVVLSEPIPPSSSGNVKQEEDVPLYDSSYSNVFKKVDPFPKKEYDALVDFILSPRDIVKDKDLRYGRTRKIITGRAGSSERWKNLLGSAELIERVEALRSAGNHVAALVNLRIITEYLTREQVQTRPPWLKPVMVSSHAIDLTGEDIQ